MMHSFARLGEFFQDDAGGFSATRLQFHLWGFVLCTLLVIAAFRGTTLPFELWVAALVTFLGLGGFKVLQKLPETRGLPVPRGLRGGSDVRVEVDAEVH